MRNFVRNVDTCDMDAAHSFSFQFACMKSDTLASRSCSASWIASSLEAGCPSVSEVGVKRVSSSVESKCPDPESGPDSVGDGTCGHTIHDPQHIQGLGSGET